MSTEKSISSHARPAGLPDYSKFLSAEEVQQRLLRFNLTNDWKYVTNGIPRGQEVNFMYPEMNRLMTDTDEQHKERLLKLWGPLIEDFQFTWD